MSINKAIESVRQHVIKTGKSAAEAVSFMWGRLDLSEQDIDLLAQEGLRQRLARRTAAAVVGW